MDRSDILILYKIMIAARVQAIENSHHLGYSCQTYAELIKGLEKSLGISE